MIAPKHHVPNLDMLRGLAVLGVFLFHSLFFAFGFDRLGWNGLLRNFDTSKSFLLLFPLTYGYAGVAIFFVVSGFCIHLSHATSTDQSWSYYIHRRFFRIYPPYLLSVLVFFFVWPWGNASDLSFDRIAQLVSHLLTIHNLHEGLFFAINPSFWSIAVEVQLYAIFPLLAWLASKFGWKRTIVITACIEFSIRAYATYYLVMLDKVLVLSSPFAYLLSWSIGAFVAQCYMRSESSMLTRLNPIILAFVAFCVPLCKLTAAFDFPVFALTTAVVIAQLVDGRITVANRMFIFQHLAKLGTASFSFYLVHHQILTLFPRFMHSVLPALQIDPLFSFVCLLTLYFPTLWVSMLMFRYIEMPSVALGSALWRRWGMPNLS